MVNYNKLYYFYIITLRGSMNQAAQQYTSVSLRSVSQSRIWKHFLGSHFLIVRNGI